MKKQINMLEGPLLSGILRFAFPIILTNLLQILYIATYQGFFPY